MLFTSTHRLQKDSYNGLEKIALYLLINIGRQSSYLNNDFRLASCGSTNILTYTFIFLLVEWCKIPAIEASFITAGYPYKMVVLIVVASSVTSRIKIQ